MCGWNRPTTGYCNKTKHTHMLGHVTHCFFNIVKCFTNWYPLWFNIRPEQNVGHIQDSIFRCISLMKMFVFGMDYHLMYPMLDTHRHRYSTDLANGLAQDRRLNQCWPLSMTPYGIIRPDQGTSFDKIITAQYKWFATLLFSKWNHISLRWCLYTQYASWNMDTVRLWFACFGYIISSSL